jgi:hypothetical protein
MSSESGRGISARVDPWLKSGNEGAGYISAMNPIFAAIAYSFSQTHQFSNPPGGRLKARSSDLKPTFAIHLIDFNCLLRGNRANTCIDSSF